MSLAAVYNGRHDSNTPWRGKPVPRNVWKRISVWGPGMVNR
jgi:hypothetical protein